MTGLTVTVRRISARNSDEYVRLLHLLVGSLQVYKLQ